jgi:hypothetical protein
MNYIRHIRSCGVFALALITNTFFSGLLGQYLEVADGTIVHDELERSCVDVLMEPGAKDIKDNISDWMKDEHDVRLKGFGFLANADVLTAEEVRIPDISTNQMDFYVSVVENGDYSEMSVFGSFGYNIHITPEAYPEEYRALKKLVFDFLDAFLPVWYQDQIDGMQKMVADLEKEQNQLQDHIADNEKRIEALQKENVQKKEELEGIRTDLRKNEDILKARKEKRLGINSRIEINRQRNM